MGRPRVITCNIASIDGRLTIAPGVRLITGEPRWNAIAGDTDPYAWVRDVHDPDVLLEGSGSFVPDDAGPVRHPPFDGDPAPLYEHFLPDDVVRVPERRWMAVVDGRGRVRLEFTEWPEEAWKGWHALVVTSRAATPGHLAWLREAGIPYLVAGPGPVDLPEAMVLLQRELAVTTVVATGGGRLGGALLQAGLVDEVDVEYVPAIIGGRGTPALFDRPPLGPEEAPVPLRLSSVDVVDGGHVRLRFGVAESEGPR